MNNTKLKRRTIKSIVNPEEVRKGYWDESLSVEEIARRYGFTKSAIYYYMQKHKIPRTRPRKTFKISSEKLRKLYYDEELPCAEIAKICNCSTTTIVNNMKRKGIPRRKAGHTKGNICWNQGKPRSEETKRKISSARKQRWASIPPDKRKFTEEHKKKLSELSRARGFKHSEETKRKMSIVRKGIIFSEEHKRKLRKASLKRVFPKKDTSIEVALQRGLTNNGIKYSKHLPVCGICQPDLVFPERKIAIFADGDYWHSKEFDNGQKWKRDRYIDSSLREAGWTVLRFWEHEINNKLDSCLNSILKVI